MPLFLTLHDLSTNKIRPHFGEIEASNIIYFIATFFHESAILQTDHQHFRRNPLKNPLSAKCKNFPLSRSKIR